jgi:hypothetical protein
MAAIGRLLSVIAEPTPDGPVSTLRSLTTGSSVVAKPVED